MPPDSQIRRGFTLIELLVVVAVIAVLVSVLLPALAFAQRAARRAVCASNLKQDGTALQMYTNDNNGTYPYIYNDTYERAQTGSAFDLWDINFPERDAMIHYGATHKTMFCPDDVANITNQGLWSVQPGQYFYPWTWGGYGFLFMRYTNANAQHTPAPLFGTYYGTNNVPVTYIQRVQNTGIQSKMQLMVDTIQSVNGFGFTKAWGNIVLTPHMGVGPTPHGANELYVDTHVSWTPFGALVPGSQTTATGPIQLHQNPFSGNYFWF